MREIYFPSNQRDEGFYSEGIIGHERTSYTHPTRKPWNRVQPGVYYFDWFDNGISSEDLELVQFEA